MTSNHHVVKGYAASDNFQNGEVLADFHGICAQSDAVRWLDRYTRFGNFGGWDMLTVEHDGETLDVREAGFASECDQ